MATEDSLEGFSLEVGGVGDGVGVVSGVWGSEKGVWMCARWRMASEGFSVGVRKAVLGALVEVAAMDSGRQWPWSF
jgi:hypothetical protein